MRVVPAFRQLDRQPDHSRLLQREQLLIISIPYGKPLPGDPVVFSGLLKLDSKKADETACRIEHVIGETVLSRIVLLVEAIAEREDCAPLREYLATTMPKLSAEAGEDDGNLIPLSELPVGQPAVVVRVDENLRGLKKFADLGLVPGTLLQLEGHAPFGDLLRVRIMGSSLSLRAGDAAFISVKLT